MTQTDRGRQAPPLVACAKHGRKDGARAMTPKERIQMHKQIVQSNARKLREWKQKKGGSAA